VADPCTSIFRGLPSPACIVCMQKLINLFGLGNDSSAQPKAFLSGNYTVSWANCCLQARFPMPAWSYIGEYLISRHADLWPLHGLAGCSSIWEQAESTYTRPPVMECRPLPVCCSTPLPPGDRWADGSCILMSSHPPGTILRVRTSI